MKTAEEIISILSGAAIAGLLISLTGLLSDRDCFNAMFGYASGMLFQRFWFQKAP